MRTIGFKPIYDAESSPYGWEGYQFGSLHTGGIYFAMSDGAVRFISININDTTFNNLGHRSDGNILGEF